METSPDLFRYPLIETFANTLVGTSLTYLNRLATLALQVAEVSYIILEPFASSVHSLVAANVFLVFYSGTFFLFGNFPSS